MIKNLQLYLREGLTKSIGINADAKRFIQATSKDFYDFISENELVKDVMYYNSELLSSFEVDYNYKDMTPQRFSTWLFQYAKHKGYKITKDKNHKGRYIIFSDL
jgi:hypothetical protein